MIVNSKTKPGIKITTTVSRKGNCNLELVIPAQYCTSKCKLVIKEYPTFYLELTFSCKDETYSQGLCLNFNGLHYPRDKDGNIRIEKSAAIKLNISGKDYKGSLIVYRKVYLTPKKLKKLLKKRKEKRKEDKMYERAIAIHESHPKPSSSKFTPYTVSNVGKPYSGGGF